MLLKSSTIIVLQSISPFMALHNCLIYCAAPMLGANILTIISSSYIEPLIIVQCPSLSLVTFFILKFILSDMSIATPAFFWSLFAWNIFFRPLTFNLYVSLEVKWVSWRQHIYGSCFCIHSASLCLLVGTFSPFTF